MLSGGASLGAIHVGMLLALADEGERADLIVGTSVGALNGGWIASRPDLPGIRGLADLWVSLSRKDIFPTHPIAGEMGMLGRRSHLAVGRKFDASDGLPDQGMRGHLQTRMKCRLAPSTAAQIGWRENRSSPR